MTSCACRWDGDTVVEPCGAHAAMVRAAVKDALADERSRCIKAVDAILAAELNRSASAGWRKRAFAHIRFSILLGRVPDASPRGSLSGRAVNVLIRLLEQGVSTPAEIRDHLIRGGKLPNGAGDKVRNELRRAVGLEVSSGRVRKSYPPHSTV